MKPLDLMLRDTPPAFQKWAEEKKTAQKELFPLHLAEQANRTADLAPWLESFPALRLTRQQGVEALELVTDLLLMNRDVPTLNEDGASWLKSLRAKRNPMTSGLDSEKEKAVKQLTWPAFTQARWSRTGDRAGVEIRFTVYNDLDLKKQIEGLDRVRAEAAEKLWT